MNPLFLLFSILIISLIIRIPVPYALFLSSIITIIYSGLSLMLVIQRMFSGLNNFALIAVPLFILAGAIMGHGGITDRLLTLSERLVGRIPGALAHINIIVSMFFAGLTGSSVADTAAIGGILIPAMIKQGYSRNISVVVTAASSTIGIIIPPSIFMVVYSAMAGVSTGAMFLGGAIPGLLVGLGQMLLVAILAKKHQYPCGTAHSLKEKADSFIKAIPVLMVPLIIIGGIISGVFTATESAVVAVVYSCLFVLVTYKKLPRKININEMFEELFQQVGSTLFCVAGATVFAYVLTYFGLPGYIGALASSMNLGRIGALFFVFLLYTILGTFMSGVATIISFMPVVQAIGEAGGVHPVTLGVIACMTMALGLITPPYGLCLMLASKLGDIEIITAFKSALIFLLFFSVVVILCILFPEIILFLPRLLMPNSV